MSHETDTTIEDRVAEAIESNPAFVDDYVNGAGPGCQTGAVGYLTGWVNGSTRDTLDMKQIRAEVERQLDEIEQDGYDPRLDKLRECLDGRGVWFGDVRPEPVETDKYDYIVEPEDDKDVASIYVSGGTRLARNGFQIMGVSSDGTVFIADNWR